MAAKIFGKTYRKSDVIQNKAPTILFPIMVILSLYEAVQKVGSDGDGLKALLAKPHRKHTLFGSGEFVFF
jgi:hypothetical protein